jgi:hypothetical protein
MSTKGKGDIKKQSEIVQQIKESQTLDKKHKEMVNIFNLKKNKEEEISNEILNINKEIDELSTFDNCEYAKKKNQLIDKKNNLQQEKDNFFGNYDEMDYYDRTGDLIIQYYEIRDNTNEVKKAKNILEFL